MRIAVERNRSHSPSIISLPFYHPVLMTINNNNKRPIKADYRHFGSHFRSLIRREGMARERERDFRRRCQSTKPSVTLFFNSINGDSPPFVFPYCHLVVSFSLFNQSHCVTKQTNRRSFLHQYQWYNYRSSSGGYFMFTDRPTSKRLSSFLRRCRTWNCGHFQLPLRI